MHWLVASVPDLDKYDAAMETLEGQAVSLREDPLMGWNFNTFWEDQVIEWSESADIFRSRKNEHSKMNVSRTEAGCVCAWFGPDKEVQTRTWSKRKLEDAEATVDYLDKFARKRGIVILLWTAMGELPPIENYLVHSQGQESDLG